MPGLILDPTNINNGGIGIAGVRSKLNAPSSTSSNLLIDVKSTSSVGDLSVGLHSDILIKVWY